MFIVGCFRHQKTSDLLIDHCQGASKKEVEINCLEVKGQIKITKVS